MKSSPSTSKCPASNPAAVCLNDCGKSRVIFSTAIRLANSPAFAPPIPSLTAKTKSAVASEASPIFPR